MHDECIFSGDFNKYETFYFQLAHNKFSFVFYFKLNHHTLLFCILCLKINTITINTDVYFAGMA